MCRDLPPPFRLANYGYTKVKTLRIKQKRELKTAGKGTPPTPSLHSPLSIPLTAPTQFTSGKTTINAGQYLLGANTEHTECKAGRVQKGKKAENHTAKRRKENNNNNNYSKKGKQSKKKKNDRHTGTTTDMGHCCCLPHTRTHRHTIITAYSPLMMSFLHIKSQK